MSPQEADETFEEAEAYFKAAISNASLYFSRAFFLALLAMWLSSLQSFSDYPEWLVGLTVFATSLNRRYRLVGWVLILWLAALTIA